MSLTNIYRGHVHKISVGIIMIVLLLAGSVAAAQADGSSAENADAQVAAVDDFNITKVGHFGGRTYAAALSGNYVYIGQGGDLGILDITSKSAPVEIGRVETNGTIRDITVAENYAYVADNDNGLVIVDISNPASPVLKGSYDTAGNARGVAVAGNYAYVTDEGNGLVILRIGALSTVSSGTQTTTPFAPVTGSGGKEIDDANSSTTSGLSGFGFVTALGSLLAAGLVWNRRKD